MHSNHGLPRTMALLLALTVALCSTNALAASVKWNTTNIEQQGEGWKLELAIFLNSPPDIPHVPMRFSFTQITYFERSLVDGRSEPIERRVPMANQQPIVESVDVGFMDPGSGKTQNRTKFSFRITRSHGFESGEYNVTIKNGRTDASIGGTTRLTLKGENEVIDRRSMVFETKKKEEKKEEKEEEEERPRKKELNPKDDAFWAGGSSAPPEEEGDDIPPPAHMEEKPGACGCRAPGHGASQPSHGLSALLALGLLVVRRRRGPAPGLSLSRQPRGRARRARRRTPPAR